MTTPTTQEKPSIARLFSGMGGADESDLYKCVHCGFCLQACPTYLETGLETESPRGRIALMKGVNEGRIEMTERSEEHTSELQSRRNLVCRLLLEKKK